MAFDPDKYLAEKAPQGFDPDAYLASKGAGEKPSSFGRDAIDYSLRALDYLGGAARTSAAGVAGGIDYLTTGENPVTQEDVINTLKGKAPSSAQYMDKFGVPEGGKVNVPLVGDISTRDALGFVGDVALDPLTYLTGGASAAAKVGTEKAVGGAVARATLKDRVAAL